MNRPNRGSHRLGQSPGQPSSVQPSRGQRWLRAVSVYHCLCLAVVCVTCPQLHADVSKEPQQPSDTQPVETGLSSGVDTQGPRYGWHRAAVISEQLSRQREFAAELRASSTPDEQIWQGESESEQTLMLFRPAQTRPARGVAVVLFSRMQPFDGNPLLESQAGLRVALPRHGWSTLALALPDPVPLLQAPRDTEDWRSENAERLLQDRRRIAERFAAAQKLAASRTLGGKQIWLAGGEGAAWLTWYLSGAEAVEPGVGTGNANSKDEARGKQRRGAIDGLVLIDFHPGRQFPQPVPVATAIEESESASVPETTYLRLRTFDLPLLILEHEAYPWPRDLMLPVRGELHTLPGRGADATLIRTLRGWLKRQTS